MWDEKSTAPVHPAGLAKEVTLRFLSIVPCNMFSAGAVDPADLRFRRLRVRSTLSFMYHPTSVRTSVESTQQRLDCIQVWQITVGHLSGNLHITFSSILLLSEDDLNMLDTQP